MDWGKLRRMRGSSHLLPIPGGIRLTVTERCEIDDWCHACAAAAASEAASTEREQIKAEINTLRAEVEALKGCIPAYRPCPCDCVVERDGQYFVECDCFNQGGLLDAQSWAIEMSIIARFEKGLKHAGRQEEK